MMCGENECGSAKNGAVVNGHRGFGIGELATDAYTRFPEWHSAQLFGERSSVVR